MISKHITGFFKHSENYGKNYRALIEYNGYLNFLKCDSNTCYFAGVGGHLEILEWARQNGCP